MWCKHVTSVGYTAIDPTTYDPDSVMNYCHDSREYSGRMSDLDVAHVQQLYPAPSSGNADRDAWPDYADNCPYVANDQADTNFEAEREVQRRAGFMDPNEGHRPLSTDPPSYVAHWHAAYKGDACDPVATTSTTPTHGDSLVDSRQGCYTVYFGGIQGKVLDPSRTCSVRINTRLGMDGWTGGPVGLSRRRGANTVSTPVFCPCPEANTPGWESACAVAARGCLVARDEASPYADAPVQSGYTKITTFFRDPMLGTWSQVDSMVTVHQNRMTWFTPETAVASWEFLRDLSTTFGMPNVQQLPGVLWTQVRQYNYSLLRPFNRADLQNSYIPHEASWDYGVYQYKWVAPFFKKWIRVPYCDPSPLHKGKTFVQGKIPFMVPDATSGQVLVARLDVGGPSEVASFFNESGRTVLAQVAAGKELLVADDRVAYEESDAVGPSALLVDVGTTRIAGYMELAANGVGGALISPTGSDVLTPLRAFAAGRQRLFWLQPSGSDWRLGIDELSKTLAGMPTRELYDVTQGALFSPRALAYDRVTDALYVLDRKDDGSNGQDRLVRLSQDGTAEELWAAAESVSAGAAYFLSTTVVGDVILSRSAQGTVDVLWMSPSGRPLGAVTVEGVLHHAVVAHAGGATLPLEQTPTEDQPNLRLELVRRDDFGFGVCGSSYFRSTAAGTVGSGALVDGPVCP